MNKHSKCGCREQKCRCKGNSKSSRKNKSSHEAKLGSSSNPIHFAFPTQNNDYDVKLNTIFGKNPYRNVLGNFGDFKAQGIGVFFNQGMPSNRHNIRDLENANGRDMTMTENRLGFNSDADLDSYIYDDWTHSIPDQSQSDLSDDWSVATSNQSQYEFNRHWNDKQNNSNDLINLISTSPNTTLSHIQDSEVSPLDNFFQPTQDNNLVSPINLFPATPNNNDDEEVEESPILQKSAETEGVPKEYLVVEEEESDEEEESEEEVGTEEEEEEPDNHRWLFYGIMPSFPEFDAIDRRTFSNNTEYDRAIMRVRDINRRDVIRGMIKFKSDGIRGESKSKFESRNLKSLRELYAKVSLFQDYNLRRNSQP